MTREIIIAGRRYQVELKRSNVGWECEVRSPDQKEPLQLKLDAVLTERDVLSLVVEGKSYEAKREFTPGTSGGMTIVIGSWRYPVELRDPRGWRSRQSSEGDGPRMLRAPMPGKVVRVLVEEGAAVESGEGILIIEAMKMQNELKSPKKGRVLKIYASVGAAVTAGEELAIVE